MPRKLLLVMLLACGVGVHAAAAQPADVWAGVNELHERKNTFVAALRQFAEAMAGSYGDEGLRLGAALDAMQRSLDAWDQAIAVYENAAHAAAQTADLHAALGSAYLDRLRAQDALREFAAAAALDSRRADVHALSASAYEFAGNSAAALAELAKARAIDPVAGDAIRAGLLRQVAGVAPICPPQIYVAGFQRLARGQLSEGLAQLRATVAADSLAMAGAASASVRAGLRLRLGELQAAMASLRLAPAPADAETERVTGVAYWADEQYDKAIAALTAAIGLNPLDERARVALADVLVAAGRQTDAERVLNEVIAAMPGSGQAHYRLAQIYQAQSKIGDAVAQYEKAATCAPLTGLDHLFDVIGGLYATQADLAHAADAYRRRIGVNPNNAAAHRELAEIYGLQGLDERALAEYGIARSLDPRDAAAATGVAQIDLRLGRFSDAARAAGDAIAIDPGQQKARFALGTALTRLGDAPGGQRELALFQQQVDDTAARRRRALDIDALAAEGARALAAGDYAKAAQTFQRALDAAPAAAVDDVGIQIQLATALIKAGQPRDAIAHLTHAISVRNDDAEAHRLAADAYAATGQPEDREREDRLYRVLIEQQKEQRLRQRPLLR